MRNHFSNSHILWLFILLIVGSSCGIVKKGHTSVSNEAHDTNVFKFDTTSADHNDSTAYTNNSKGSVKENTTTTVDGIDIEFNDSDPSDSVDIRPITVTRTTAGVNVDPGGRKVKKLAVSNQTIDAKRESVDTSAMKYSNVAKSKVDSGSNLKVVDTQKKNTTDTNKVFKWQVPWYAWVIICVFVIIMIRYRLWRKSIFAAKNIPDSNSLPKIENPPDPPSLVKIENEVKNILDIPQLLSYEIFTH